jgi:hypothetical protein
LFLEFRTYSILYQTHHLSPLLEKSNPLSDAVGGCAQDVLKDSLEDLMCQNVRGTFDAAVAEFPRNTMGIDLSKK